MNGRQIIRVASESSVYEVELRDKISFIRGDSGTHKSLFVDLVYDWVYEQNRTTITLVASSDVFVLSDYVNVASFISQVNNVRNSIVVVDENNNKYIGNEQFVKAVRSSDCYFVIISRHIPANLAVSTKAIYEFKREVRDGVEYFSNSILYSTNASIQDLESICSVIVEDEKSGLHFLRNVFGSSANVISANGNFSIKNALRSVYRALVNDDKTVDGIILVVADGAAFGAVIESLFVRMARFTKRRIVLWLPVCFEEVILKTGEFDKYCYNDIKVSSILCEPFNYINFEETLSYERYFYRVLVDVSSKKAKDLGSIEYQYRKSDKGYGKYYLSNHFTDRLRNTVANLLSSGESRVCPLCGADLSESGLCTNLLCNYKRDNEQKLEMDKDLAERLEMLLE